VKITSAPSNRHRKPKNNMLQGALSTSAMQTPAPLYEFALNAILYLNRGTDWQLNFHLWLHSHLAQDTASISSRADLYSSSLLAHPSLRSIKAGSSSNKAKSCLPSFLPT